MLNSLINRFIILISFIRRQSKSSMCMSDFRCISVLGRGHFGKVCEVTRYSPFGSRSKKPSMYFKFAARFLRNFTIISSGSCPLQLYIVLFFLWKQKIVLKPFPSLFLFILCRKSKALIAKLKYILSYAFFQIKFPVLLTNVRRNPRVYRLAFFFAWPDYFMPTQCLYINGLFIVFCTGSISRIQEF